MIQKCGERLTRKVKIDILQVLKDMWICVWVWSFCLLRSSLDVIYFAPNLLPSFLNIFENRN